MLLRTLTLENFGLYAGVNKLDLVPTRRAGRESPVVLVGGKNGSGKTTILESVRLALYGRLALGTRVSKSEYDGYLVRSIHRAEGISYAAVTLEFDYAEAGTVFNYKVRREWTLNGGSPLETLSLEKDGTPITSVPRDEWNLFLQELIPPGVSQLFFFDGEKIKEIAESQDNDQLALAIRGLLGIELVGRLRSDLSLYLARHESGEQSSQTTRLEVISKDTASLEGRVVTLREEIAELHTARDSQARAAEQIRRQFVSEGGDAAAQRAKVESQYEEIKRRIERGEVELRNLANGLLPFAIAPRLIASFRSALAEAGTGSTKEKAAEAMREALLSWRSTGIPARKGAWTPKHWIDIEEFLNKWTLEPSEDENSSFRDLGDGTAALSRLSEVDATIRPHATALLAELDFLYERRIELEHELSRADNAAAGLLLDELRRAEQRVGATETLLEARNADLAAVKSQQAVLSREKKQLEVQQALIAGTKQRTQLASKVAQTLTEYENRLHEHKLVQLRTEFVSCFNRLVRKQGFIADVAINHITFETTLIDQRGNEISKSILSAGERQIYAISMLWALARTSGRPLPMIIDTPLARLDSEHRQNLVERYFPAASHQVILLSTDTEIDADLFKKLGSSVSHMYTLDYDSTQGATSVLLGYFESSHVQEAKRAV